MSAPAVARRPVAVERAAVMEDPEIGAATTWMAGSAVHDGPHGAVHRAMTQIGGPEGPPKCRSGVARAALGSSGAGVILRLLGRDLVVGLLLLVTLRRSG